MQNCGDYLKTIKMLSAYLGPRRSLERNLDVFLQNLAQKHGFLRAHLILFEPETGLLCLRSADSFQDANKATYSPGVGVTGQVFTTGKPFIIPKISEDLHFKNLLFSRTKEEMENLAFISVPVLAPIGYNTMNARDVIGTLNVDSTAKNMQELEEQCLLLEIISSFIASSVAQVQDEISRIKRYEIASDVINLDTIFLFSRAMKHIVEQTNYYAQGRFPLLLYGEAGVGKEILAKRIHNISSRKDMPFIVCHCSTIPQEKMNAELVGYQKGVFENAVHSHKGLLEQAQGGTIFLHGIENLSKDAQETLLYFIQKHEIIRLGATKSIVLDVRLIVSTSVYLESLLENNAFNPELFTRLNVYSVQIPPLRERKEDIIPLAEQMLVQLEENDDEKKGKRISYPAAQLLSKYYWAGNIPELLKCMEYAIKHCKDNTIRASDLPVAIQSAENDLEENELAFGESVENFEKELIVDALIKASGNILKASSILKSSYRIINYKIKKYKINTKQFMGKAN